MKIDFWYIYNYKDKKNNMYKEGKKRRNIKFETDIETEKNRNKNKAES